MFFSLFSFLFETGMGIKFPDTQTSPIVPVLCPEERNYHPCENLLELEYSLQKCCMVSHNSHTLLADPSASF